MPTQDADTVLLEIPCAEVYLKVVRLAVAGAGSRADLTVQDIEDLKVAVGEACNNVIYHAFDEETMRSGAAKIRITMFIRRGELRVEVEDEGRGFDPSRVPSPVDSQTASERMGMGLYLMKQMCDLVRVESAPGSGTKVIIVKRRSR